MLLTLVRSIPRFLLALVCFQTTHHYNLYRCLMINIRKKANLNKKKNLFLTFDVYSESVTSLAEQMTNSPLHVYLRVFAKA